MHFHQRVDCPEILRAVYLPARIARTHQMIVREIPRLLSTLITITVNERLALLHELSRPLIHLRRVEPSYVRLAALNIGVIVVPSLSQLGVVIWIGGEHRLLLHLLPIAQSFITIKQCLAVFHVYFFLTPLLAHLRNLLLVCHVISPYTSSLLGRKTWHATVAEV